MSESLDLTRESRQASAIEAFRATGTIVHACEAAGIARSTWYEWLDSDPEFAAAAAEADEKITASLEKAAIEQALSGSGSVVAFLLKARRPQKYRDRLIIETVSPEVLGRLRATADAVVELCDRELARKVLARMDEIWR